MRGLLENVLLNPFVLLPVGLALALIGAFAVADVPTARGRASRVEGLRPAAVTAAGQAAFIEGRVSGQTPTVHRQFVAYLREQYLSGVERSSHWEVVARQTPPLVIETRGTAVRVVNNDYSLESTDVTVEEQPPTFTKGASQSRGFVAGSPVLAVGSVADGAGGLAAEFLYAGTRDEYVAHLRGTSHGALRWGGGFLFAGVGCIALGVWRLRLFLREEEATQKAVESRQVGRVKESDARGVRRGKKSKRRRGG